MRIEVSICIGHPEDPAAAVSHVEFLLPEDEDAEKHAAQVIQRAVECVDNSKAILESQGTRVLQSLIALNKSQQDQ